jgi:hypothetical protein
MNIENYTYITYDIYTNSVNEKYLKNIVKNIQQTGQLKNGIPQNNGEDDLGGKLNFIRVFGKGVSRGCAKNWVGRKKRSAWLSGLMSPAAGPELAATSLVCTSRPYPPPD